jgi:hypothetical protein
VFIANFRETIHLILNEFYRINAREDLQKQIWLVEGLAGKAYDDLVMVKTEIERGFSSASERSEWILAKLGFKTQKPHRKELPTDKPNETNG